jgi:predicted AlkP superfamily phosphohydrolase/phosphomutase
LFIEYLVGLDYFGKILHVKEYTNYSNLNSSLFNYYKFFDSHVGEIINNIGDNTILIIVSDHGTLKYQSENNYTFSNMRKEKGILYFYNYESYPIMDNDVYNIFPIISNILHLT